jgi:hypothetical protein
LCLSVTRVASASVSGGGWMFLWLMVALKVPIAALLGLVWWAARAPQEAEPEQRDWQPRRPPEHPRPRRPRPPRRGPHAGPQPVPPERTRVHAKARTLSH